MGELRWIASAPACPDELRLAALVEEVGEAARALHDGDLLSLSEELVHVAAVAVAWIEGIEP
jgi:sorbitol-specific phosphotransferase system component IIA